MRSPPSHGHVSCNDRSYSSVVQPDEAIAYARGLPLNTALDRQHEYHAAGHGLEHE
jgi:hypothetical protein